MKARIFLSLFFLGFLLVFPLYWHPSKASSQEVTPTPTESPTPTPTPAPGFIETGGTVVFEGEHFDSNITRDGHTWTSGSDAGAVGGTYINTPNNGLKYTPPDSAETQYLITLSTTGTYYVWLRGYAPNGTGNAIGVGLDGAPTTNPINFANYNSWIWGNTDSTGSPVEITVSSAGTHTFSVWERKDGTRLDRVVLTTSSTAPLGNGPDESPRNTPTVTPTPTETVTPTPTITNTPTPTPTVTPVPGKSTMNLKSSYSFDVNLDYGASKITVDQTVNITNKSNEQVSTLNFSVIPQAFGEFNLKSLTVDGKNADYSWTNNSNLAVNLNDYLNSGDQTTVNISFVENPTNDTSTYLKSSLSKANGIMQVSNWFPIISNGHALRMPGDSQYSLVSDSFHMELRLNRSMPFAAPGTVSSPTTLKRVVNFGPARNFAFSVCPKCKTKTGTIDGIKVKAVYLSGSGGATAFTNAKNSLHTFNTKFVKYPYDTYVVAQATRPNSGNEFPGIIFVGDTKLESLDVVRHETAHQWFYGLLGNDQMNDPWLDEAFAQWAGSGFTGHKYCSGKLVSSSIYDFPDKFDYKTAGNCGSYDQTVYYKGATFIEGVRTRMGDTAFFNSLNNLFSNYRFDAISTSIVARNWLDYSPNNSRDSLRNYMQNYINW
ncbi:MAG: peptidase M1 membrane alanine aminopeptidase [Candidatus Beckwithbacteria bacterium GW2011_GWA2_43_10]|uniref:Peptidase M1 membrane alanine aminopeptidase n=1 Tax=Candidatus Beckwithbacteria bacterium GW2011_GWA2_43_10 TaxID=1618369 RepID=A0A0G1C3H9_9BACT|nr:MAG: peptidase M1 membrane alanine aminopeptidase [Candidatus Beckwithbacteria bacterium GW2011_GWA2_43_10]